MQIRTLVVLLSALLLGEAAMAMAVTNRSHAYDRNYELDIKNTNSGRLFYNQWYYLNARRNNIEQLKFA